MTAAPRTRRLDVLTSSADGLSVWIQRSWPTETRGGMVITPRIGCSSLRLRTSEPGYVSGWHVAGDPTLIVVQRGGLRISLRDGGWKDFWAGDAFIAADRLSAGQAFDDTLHGHQAKVVGDVALEAVHLKLQGFDPGPVA